MNAEAAKRAVARAAIAELPPEGTVGLGSGSTIAFFIEEIARAVASGSRYSGVPTSDATRRLAGELGVSQLDDSGPWDIDVCVDGADEVDPQLDLIKGRGGALTREKIVNASARKNVIIVDASKLSPRLGERCAVPIEVLAFAHVATKRHLERFGAPALRMRDAAPYRTDNGNVIYDLAVGPLSDARALDRELRTIPGVVETGLFLGRASVVLIAHPDGRIERRAAPLSA